MAHRVGQGLVGLAIGAIAALALPSAASAKTVCTVGVSAADPTPTMVVTHTDDPDDPGDNGRVTITIRRDQATLRLLEDAVPVPCSGSPALVTEVDRIAYDNSGGISDLILEEPDTFVPGKAAERASGDRVVVREPDGILDDVVLRDGNGAPTATSSGRARPPRTRST